MKDIVWELGLFLKETLLKVISIGLIPLTFHGCVSEMGGNKMLLDGGDADTATDWAAEG